MKNSLRFLAAGVTMACAFGATADETAFEGQPIGSIAVTSSTTNTIVAVAFNELSPVDGQGISVSNILSTVNLVPGDKVFVIDGNVYKSWTLNAQKNWEAVNQTYTIGANGNTLSGVGDQANTLTNNIGQGFWLQRVPTGRDLSQPFYIFGAAVAVTSTAAAAGVKSLLGNPGRTAMNLTTTGAHLGDTIALVVNDTALMKEYKYVTINSENTWGELKAGTVIPKYQSATVTIPAGGGFWYNSTGGDAVTLNWADPAPAAQ